MPPLTGRTYDRSRLERTPGHPLACPPGGVHIGLLGHRRFPKRPETLIASPAQDHLRIVGSNPWPQPAHPQGLLTSCKREFDANFTGTRRRAYHYGGQRACLSSLV
jgi:hypothetical protein